MGERISDAERAAEHRFNDFVARHAEQALRWEMVEERSGVPIQLVDFSVTDNHDREIPPTSSSPAIYSMNIRVGLSKDNRKKYGVATAGILLEAREEEKVLTITDDRDQLQYVLGCGSADASRGPQAVGMLLDKMQGLEDSGLLIPAGRRTFSLDGNTINTIRSLEE